MNPDLSTPPMTRSEQETENEGNRLIEQVESALAIVAVRSSDESDALEAAADRIERAARDLSDALRQLSRERRTSAAGN
jgi:hypothetical protein